MKTKQKYNHQKVKIFWCSPDWLVGVKKSFKYQEVLVLFFVVLFIFGNRANAASPCDNIFISEVQISGGTGKIANDFIELFNAGVQTCDLKGYRLVKRTKNGTTDTAIKAWDSLAVISAKGYYLWANSGGDYAQSLGADASTTQDISNDNGIALRYGSNDTGVIIDAVGWGTCQNIFSTINIFPTNPLALQSLERIFSDGQGGAFQLNATPDPKNSLVMDDNDEQDDNKIPVCKDKIVLSEIFPFSGEFVEVENIGTEKCDLAGWKIGDAINSPYAFPADSVIEAGEFISLVHDFGLNSGSADSTRLFNLGGSDPIEVRTYEKTESDHSYSKNDSNEWKWTGIITSGKNNEFEVPKEYTDDINITELFPDPDKSEYEEYVELYNGTAEDVDLIGWKLHDASLSGEYVFKESMVIKTGKYLAIFKKDFGFALNNDDESVTLYDPNNKQVSSVAYSDGKKDASYNFNDSVWRWSKFLTPGEENIFNNAPYGTLTLDDDFFVNVYANFSVSTGDLDGDSVKVAWDFGDDHKSYLAKTTHKYEKVGTYNGNVKLSDGSEDVVKNFTVDVKEFPHPKVRIVAINANPVGADTGVEYLTIENQSNKKINLNGWSIATGWKKFINHPIKEDVIIKKNKSENLTSSVSSFTLNNTKAKIQLRYPDGKVASEVKYKSPNKTIAEGEVYQKVKGGWAWLKAKQETITKTQDTNEIENIQDITIDTQNITNDVQNSGEEVVKEVAGAEIVKRKIELFEKDDLCNIKISELDSCGLGIETMREINGQYFFTTQNTLQQHYAIAFFNDISSGLNSKINSLLNYFL